MNISCLYTVQTSQNDTGVFSLWSPVEAFMGRTSGAGLGVCGMPSKTH